MTKSFEKWQLQVKRSREKAAVAEETGMARPSAPVAWLKDG